MEENAPPVSGYSSSFGVMKNVRMSPISRMTRATSKVSSMEDTMWYPVGLPDREE